MSRPWIRRVGVALVLGLAVARPLVAQQEPESDGLSRQELLQRIQREFEERLTRELELTDEQRNALPAILSEFGAHRRELGTSRNAFMQRVRDLLAADAGNPDGALALIEEGRSLRAREEELMVQEEERLLSILNPSQVLLLQVLRDQFGDLIEAIGGRDDVERFFEGDREPSEFLGNPRR